MYGDSELVVSTGHERKTFTCQVRPVSDERFREKALEQIGREHNGAEACVEAFVQLEAGVGKLLIDLNVEISRRVALGGQALRIGVPPASLDGSIVVCLYGNPEFLSLQAALFSACRDFNRYEFIYVSNSPELAERLIKDATIASRIYGVSITLVILPGNAGFSAANNVGVNAAHSAQILILNPDVFPLQSSWPSLHTQLVKNLPPDQVAIFGVPLFYGDGSLMHSGMYFEMDTGLLIRSNQVIRREMIRVEHYAKGAPPTTESYLTSRPVPAVTGAFMSIDRSWFESLGGFSPEYIFGHYEDADLCLKSLAAGKPAWIHNVPFMHLEGKGSTPCPGRDGASLVNRWHFTSAWGEFVKSHPCGKSAEYLTVRGRP
jgi:GT2 family glycosyltransferase